MTSTKIARTWHGAVPNGKAEEYLKYLQHTGLNDYQNSEGNLGIHIFRRTENGNTHFLLLTYWDSYESIKKFAGNDYEKARYYLEDEHFLIELESFVTHYEVLDTIPR